MSALRFIDLFAGLGGFHLALRELGHDCVFASDIDPYLRDLYEQNFGLRPFGDIRKARTRNIPSHDILCAGFPCQPFSKAGRQLGLECPDWGGLYSDVIRIARHHKPAYLILENVPNLEYHDEGNTWNNRILKRLLNLGYDVQARVLSPHQFGIPQVRPRFFIVAARDGLSGFAWPQLTSDIDDLSIESILDSNPHEARKITESARMCLDTWQEFLDLFPLSTRIPSFPIWSMEFGATYPYEDATPHSVSSQLLARRKGSFGINLGQFHRTERLLHLPSYARTKATTFPRWKIKFIRQNRDFYAQHKKQIDRWMPGILPFPPSMQKFEWNCQGEHRYIRDYIIQFRASGVRVKRTNWAPSLVAMTTTQVPIIGWEERYMTPRECSRLQSMDNLEELPSASTRSYRALGNAVNVRIVHQIAKKLLRKTSRVKRGRSRAVGKG